ncbi:hypothetical protein CSOJ01_08120 [Colletotrichum sojae]|uniref:Uncharacterized protein n=1 Tax=Colletotrichum sojae TaxID=2175907 RepID=A0A8H6J7P2_9PEZI|nr:hypothetical protein CSOJ01_08120 [Colletotrichum sojae]
MRFFLAILLAALQISIASAGLNLKKCGTQWPSGWVSNCSQSDKDGCATLCGQKCRTSNLRAMANGADCDCYCV